MPTYDYECDACGHKFELFQQISESQKKKCPECKKNKLRRLFGTGAAIMFKGSGFYQTDYRSDSYKKAAEKDSKTSSESTSEAKPESKSSDAKSGDNKSSDNKSTDSKPTGSAGSSGKKKKAD